MKSSSRGGRCVWAAAAVVTVGGCTALLGVDPDLHLAGGGAGGATSTSATSNSGTGGASGVGMGKLGDPCIDVQQLACAGNAQKLQLICGSGHTWQANGTCDGSTFCDTALGVGQGTCKPVAAECAGKSPGDVFCAGLMRVECGPDLVTTEEMDTCSYVCSAGKCTGACVPLTDKKCAGNLPQSCDANGVWQNEAACSAQMPVCVAGFCGGPSCSGLQPTCGPSGNESCCTTSVLAGGTYNQSNDPSSHATVSDFRLDRFEVTVGRFRQFVASYPGSKPAAGTGAHPLIAGSGWQVGWNANLAADKAALQVAVTCDSPSNTWTNTAGENENKPMNCLSWYEAFAFCAWDGGRLPTEAEWNYAAAGGNDQRLYPWGAAAPDKAHAVYDCTGDNSAAGACAMTDILNVGSKSTVGDGKWGQADLAGGVWEWNLDWYVNSYPMQVCKNCAIVSQGSASNRVIRGGSWYHGVWALLSSYHGEGDPNVHLFSEGARCARTP